VVQSLTATESVNPYAYAWNDPLKYVDPNGHSLLGDIIGVVVGVIVAWVLPELLPEYFEALSVTTLTVAGFVGGFVGAYVSTGSLSAALTSGVISAVSAGTAAAASPFISAVAKAVVGCAVASGSSGNCGAYAAASILSAAMPISSGGGGDLGVWGTALATVESGIIGGIEGRMSGQSFANGFSAAAAS
jgi:hypothetical protein